MVWAESSGPPPAVCWDGWVSGRKPCPSDVSGERWSLIESVISAWKDRHRSVSGRQGAYGMRKIVNADDAELLPEARNADTATSSSPMVGVAVISSVF